MKKVLFILSLVLTSFILFACNTPTQDVEPTEPTITGVDSKTIEWGSDFDPLEGVKATDEIDGDITNKIVVSGDEVNTFRSISYNVIYTVTNSKNLTTEITRVITVDYATEANLLSVVAKNDPTLTREYTKGNNLDLSKDGVSPAVPGWQSWGAGGKYSVSDGVMKVEVGTDYYQISNNGNMLKKDQYYIVTFDAKADLKQSDKAMEFTFRAIWGSEANGAWDDHTIMYFDHDIDTEWSTFAFQFKARSSEENVLCLITQGIRNTIYYKNIHVYELFPTEDDGPTAPVETDTNWDLETDDATYWNKFSGDDQGNFTVAPNALTINVFDTYLQVSNNRNKLTIGQLYKMSFDIKSSVAINGGNWGTDEEPAFNYRVIVGSEETGWTEDNIIYPSENLPANEVVHIELTFTPKYATKNVYCYIFEGFTGQVVISNIQIEEAKDEPIIPDPTTPVLGTTWGSWTGDTVHEASHTVVDQVVTYTTNGSDYYQISNNGNVLESGKTYTISFDLTPEAALAAGQFKFIYGSEEGGWFPSVDKVYEEGIEAGVKTNLSFTFTSTTNNFNALCFIFMNYVGNATLENFVIAEI